MENLEICRKCRGKCCKRSAGLAWPEDVKRLVGSFSTAGILRLLEKGTWSIDWWEGDIKPGGRLSLVYFIRPRHVGEEIIQGSWGGTCIFLRRDTGCLLDHDERPTQCREMVPEWNFEHCHGENFEKPQGVILWRRHQRILQEVVHRWRNNGD